MVAGTYPDRRASERRPGTAHTVPCTGFLVSHAHQTKALRQHNYDTMFDKNKLSLEINKTINLFLEFADTSQIPS